MAEDKPIDVLTLLEKFKGWIESKDVQFLGEKKRRDEVLRSVGALIGRFRKANKDLKEARNDAKKKGEKYDGGLSDFLDWYKTHEEGRDLWHKLASHALTHIDETSKGNSKLFEFLKAATEFEDLLYGLEKFYRDHTLHSLWVYLIGEYILREHLKKIRKSPNWYLFNDVDTDKKEYGYSPELVAESTRQRDEFCAKVNEKRDAIWCIIALCHDLGYSLEKLGDLNKKVRAVLEFFDVSDLRHVGYFLDVEHQYLVSQFLELMAMDVRIVPSDDYWELEDLKKRLDSELKKLDKGVKRKEDRSRKEKKRLQEEYNNKRKQMVLVKCYRDDSTYWRLCRALEKKQHGILSAYLMFKLLGIFADTSIRGPAEEWGLDDEEVPDNVIRGDILFAIAQHQFDFAYLDQLSSLGDVLVLADELEEFSRLGRQLQSRKYFDTAAYAAIQFEPAEGDKITPGKRIKIRITYTSQHREPKEFLDFFRRKAERLCQLYSLKEEDQELEGDAGPHQYCSIDSIEMTVKADEEAQKEGEPQKCCFTLSSDPSKTEGWLPTSEQKYDQQGEMKEYEKGKYMMKCHEDQIVVRANGHEIPLREWLGVPET